MPRKVYDPNRNLYPCPVFYLLDWRALSQEFTILRSNLNTQNKFKITPKWLLIQITTTLIIVLYLLMAETRKDSETQMSAKQKDMQSLIASHLIFRSSEAELKKQACTLGKKQ